MAIIDIGIYLVGTGGSPTAWTIINEGNPANLSGKITSLHFYAFFDITGLIVAIFEKVGVNTFTARSSQALGDFAAGEHSDVACDLDVEAGDYIGFYQAIGGIGFETGHGGGWYAMGDHTACVNYEFANHHATYGFGIWGDGATPPAYIPRHSGTVATLIF